MGGVGMEDGWGEDGRWVGWGWKMGGVRMEDGWGGDGRWKMGGDGRLREHFPSWQNTFKTKGIISHASIRAYRTSIDDECRISSAEPNVSSASVVNRMPVQQATSDERRNAKRRLDERGEG
jgi:hypothetical protein